MSTYRSLNGHHQIWIMNGIVIIPEDIRYWLDTVAGKKWIGACAIGSMNGDREGMMYNFSDRMIALLFKLTWG